MDELGMMPLADLKNQKITNPIMSEDFEDDDQTTKALERLREQKAASMVPESFLLDREAYEDWKQSQLKSEVTKVLPSSVDEKIPPPYTSMRRPPENPQS